MNVVRFRRTGAVLLLACLPALAPGQEKPAKLPEDVQLVLKLTNEERAKQDLPPLKINRLLQKSAEKHSHNMASQGKMAHELDGEGPAARARKAGYEFSRLGENIALAPGPREAMRLWMKSEGHRANILSGSYSEIGIGIAKDDKGAVYFTQVFGEPARVRE